MKNTKLNDITYTKLLKEKVFGTSSYPGFQRRIIAALIDCTLASIVMIPLFAILGGLIYGPTPPQELISNAIRDITSLKAESQQNINITDYIKNNPEMYDYFYTKHGFIKMIIEQIVELVSLGALIVTFWIKKQATPGKMFLAMKIVDAKTLKKPTTTQFIIRIFGYIISSLPLFLGIIWIAFDPKKQAWHDKIAGTLVIKLDNDKK